MDLYSQLKNLPACWHQLIKEEVESNYFKELNNFLKKESKTKKVIYPNEDNIFRAFDLTPFSKIKAVIIGQDPYHGENQAHGLSFSVPVNEKLPPSLRNIFKELENNFSNFSYQSGDLSHWAKQGVLLLNTVLTVEKNQAGSHQNRGWETFTNFIIEQISINKENVVFFLWGKPAQQKEQLIDSNKHYILKSPHPSPLAAYRGFFNQQQFFNCNKFLKNKGLKEINWSN